MMAQQQRLVEEQKKKMEQEMKHRQFQEQQKKLREFTAIGGRKMDADSLMKSIVGIEQRGPRGQSMQQMQMAQQIQHPLAQPPTPCKYSRTSPSTTTHTL